MVPSDTLEEEAIALAMKIASNYTLEVQLQKEMVDAALDNSLEKTLAFETYCACTSFAGGARKEGMTQARDKNKK